MKNYEYFIAVAEEKSLLKASERAFVSSSALSQAISKIEEEMGAALFNRSKTGWTLTPAGEIYLETAYSVMELHKKSVAAISMINDNPQVTISIGISPGLSLNAISAILPAFSTAYPNIHVELVENKVLNVLKLVENGRIDIGILSSYIDFPTVNTVHVSADVPILAVPNSFLAEKEIHLSDRTLLSFKDMRKFEDCSFALINDNTTLRLMMNSIFEGAGFVPKPIFESDSARSVAALANIGYAAAILPSHYAQYSQNVSYFPIDTSIRWNKYAAYPLNHNLTPAEDYLIGLLKNFFALQYSVRF